MLEKWDPGPWTLHPGPGTWDPIWNRNPIPLRETRDTHININLGTLTLIQFSYNVQFSSVA